MGRYIFTFVFGFVVLCVYDRFFAHRVQGERQPIGWLVRWRNNLEMALLAVVISLFLNTLLGR